MPQPPHILIAGIGNIFLGDDAFGCEVAQRLLSRPQRQHVRVVDFGIRGLDLVYALQDGYDLVILIDAVSRDEGPPGTLYLLEPQLTGPIEDALIDPHSLDPVKVLRTALSLGAKLRKVLLVGCEPATRPDDIDAGEMPPGLSPPVSAAVEGAVDLVESVLKRFSGACPADRVLEAQKEASACPQ
ncbi:MAG TPA: hydrogenase maturation protease [Phycisphaerae bacterium]|nr:hydrogenase maturation protease [Phycisphaerae bacterium]